MSRMSISQIYFCYEIHETSRSTGRDCLPTPTPYGGGVDGQFTKVHFAMNSMKCTDLHVKPHLPIHHHVWGMDGGQFTTFFSRN